MASEHPPVVVGSGAATIDTILFVDGRLGDGKGRVIRRETRVGGNAVTALIAAARAGVQARFIGHLAGGPPGDEIRTVLGREGVDFEAAQVSALTPPIRSTILVDGHGQRFIAFDDNTAVGLDDDSDLTPVRKADVFLVDEYAPKAGLRAIEAALQYGTAVVADIERGHDPDVKLLIDHADHLVVPLEFAARWTGTPSPEDAVRALSTSRGRSAVVVTAGADGCWFRSADEGRVRHEPAVPVTVVDTTGCGDVFHGSYAAALAQGKPVVECVKAATTAAAMCATHAGGISHQPATQTQGVNPQEGLIQ